ncbi:hypothetical protein FRC12_018359 [Ceratobasidium sp. 428]|nr:hypothetical protein FRC12_018359 [Ceratobasidium sp. 428]
MAGLGLELGLNDRRSNQQQVLVRAARYIHTLHDILSEFLPAVVITNMLTVDDRGQAVHGEYANQDAEQFLASPAAAQGRANIRAWFAEVYGASTVRRQFPGMPLFNRQRLFVPFSPEAMKRIEELDLIAPGIYLLAQRINN